MQLVPRWYQLECVDAIWNYFSSGQKGNPVCLLPTATGKSVIIAMFLESIFKWYPNQKVIQLTHVKELIQQNYSKLLRLWAGAPAGVNSAGLGKRDVYDRIVFAGIQSVAKMWAAFGHVDLVIIDEAHLVSPEEETLYQQFIAGLKTINPHLKVIGLTATGWRLGQGYITDGGIFTDVAYNLTTMESFNRLIAEGYLAPLIPKPMNTQFDLGDVHKRGGEYIASELQHAVDRDEVTRAALTEALQLGQDRKHWLFFATGVQHAIHIGKMLENFGVSNVVVHSKMGDTERDKAIEAFKEGKVLAAVNNNVLTTGFDFPEIDFISVLRPTLSSSLWVQMLGRGMRPAPGKENCLVADYARNTARLGPINDPVIPRKKGEKPGKAPVKLCERCNTYNHASVRFCINCGAEFPIVVKLVSEASSNELVKGDLPVVEVFKVDHITVAQHDKTGKPPAMRVSYYCSSEGKNIPRRFDEYVCVEHDGFAGRKARQWWQQRSQEPMPKTTPEAMMLFEHLTMATDLRIWINQKYPSILAHCFDGTGFGSRVVSPDFVPPKATAHFAERFRGPSHRVKDGPTRMDFKGATDGFDDDIPF